MVQGIARNTKSSYFKSILKHLINLQGSLDIQNWLNSSSQASAQHPWRLWSGWCAFYSFLSQVLHSPSQNIHVFGQSSEGKLGERNGKRDPAKQRIPHAFPQEDENGKETYIHGFPSGWDAPGRDRFGGLCTAGIPSKRSVKTAYLQAQHKEEVDLVHQKPPARKWACTATPRVKGSWRAQSLMKLGQWWLNLQFWG